MNKQKILEYVQNSKELSSQLYDTPVEEIVKIYGTNGFKIVLDKIQLNMFLIEQELKAE